MSERKTLEMDTSMALLLGQSSQTRGPTTLLLKPLLHSLAEPWLYGGRSLLALQTAKMPPSPKAQLQAVLPCDALLGPQPSPPCPFQTPLAYGPIQTTPRHSFTHSCCVSLLLCISVECTRRWRLSSLFHAPSEPPLYWPTAYLCVSL